MDIWLTFLIILIGISFLALILNELFDLNYKINIANIVEKTYLVMKEYVDRKRYPYEIRLLKIGNNITVTNCENWIKNNNINGICYDAIFEQGDIWLVFRFRNEEDAMIFKLRWL